MITIVGGKKDKNRNNQETWESERVQSRVSPVSNGKNVRFGGGLPGVGLGCEALSESLALPY